MGEWIGNKFGELIEWAIIKALDFVLWLFDLTWQILQGMTNPDINNDFIRLWAGRMFTISLPLLATFFIAHAVTAAVKRSPSELGNALIGMIVAVIGTIFSLPLVAYLTRGFDRLADGLIATAMTDTRSNLADGIFGDLTGEQIYAIFTALSIFNGANQFATAVVLGLFFGALVLLLIIGTLALLLALLIRTNLLYIMVVIGPIMLAGTAWKTTRPWARRWASMVVALIFTKLGIVIVMAVGSGMLTGAMSGMFTNNDGEPAIVLGAVGTFLGAGLMLILAALSPVATFKFFDFLGETAVAGMHAEAKGPIDTAKHQAIARLSPAALGGHTQTAAPVAAGPAGLAGAAAIGGAQAAADGATTTINDAGELPTTSQDDADAVPGASGGRMQPLPPPPPAQGSGTGIVNYDQPIPDDYVPPADGGPAIAMPVSTSPGASTEPAASTPAPPSGGHQAPHPVTSQADIPPTPAPLPGGQSAPAPVPSPSPATAAPVAASNGQPPPAPATGEAYVPPTPATSSAAPYRHLSPGPSQQG